MDKQTLDIYDEKAVEYATKFGKDDNVDTQLGRFLEHMPDGARLWDLGCGPGRSAGLMARAGHRVLATDASAQMVALASKWDGVETRQETFDDIAGEAEFDGIFANFSLLHAEDVALPGYVARLAKALKPKGIFHIGMKTGEGMYRDGIGRRYTYVSEDGLEALLTGVGLSVIDRWTGNSPGLSGEAAPWVVMHARKDD